MGDVSQLGQGQGSFFRSLLENGRWGFLDQAQTSFLGARHEGHGLLAWPTS